MAVASTWKASVTVFSIWLKGSANASMDGMKNYYL
jgi:hypothetical protein